MRLFIGIPIPPDSASILAGAAARLPLIYRRTAPADLHITLAFLGQVSDEQLPCIYAQLEQVKQPPLTINLTGVGTFPGVAFAAVDPAPALLALAAEIVQRMATCGFPSEQRPYHPHLTLARSRDRKPKLDDLHLPPLSFAADAFTLYSSRAGDPGARYEHLRRYTLA